MTRPSSHAVIVGVQRCGTTWLATALDQHPDIRLARPLRPEPKAFLDPAIETVGAEAYRARWFDDTPGVLLEKSTSYLDHEDAIIRIRRVLPDARTIVCLRDPVDRAISHYRFSRAGGFEDRDIDAVLGDPESDTRPWDPSLVSTSPFAYHHRGQYLDRLQMLEDHIPADQLLVVILEELLGRPDAIHPTHTFLGVEPQDAPTRVPANASVGPGPEVDAHTIKALVTYFEPWNAALEDHLGRRLPWRRSSRI